MDKLLEQFRYLNPKDPGTWPVLPKLLALIALLAALVAVGYVADWQAQMDELVAGAEEEVKLKEAYKSKKQLAVNLDLYRQQLREIDSSFGALLKQLPNKSQMDALLVDINQAGLGRGLQFDLFRPAPRETMKEFYAELPVSVRVTGSYHDMGAVRERHCATVAHRHAQRYLHPPGGGQERQCAGDGHQRQDLPLSG